MNILPNYVEILFFSSAILLTGLPSGCAHQKPAELVLLGGKIVTVDDSRPEAQAIAVNGDRITAVGSDEEIRAFIDSSTKVIDLKGKLAVPGFIDGHGHFMGLGKSKMRLDLAPAKDWQAIVSMVSNAVQRAKPGDWVLGRGWHQEKWDSTPSPNIEGLPTHADLSRVSPDNPVLLVHASGHSGIANAKAMQLAGITSATQNPAGGQIVRFKNGQASGVFRETALGLLENVLDDALAKRSAQQIRDENLRTISQATRECLSKGVTSFQDAGSSLQTVDLFKELAGNNQLGVRLWVMLSDNNLQLAQALSKYKLINFANKHLTVRAIKRWIDGALGAHGAWLLEPYSDLKDSSGLSAMPLEEIEHTAKLAIQHGFQLCTHAIGDRGNREILNIYEKIFKKYPDKKNLRWRVEHAQHINPADIPRFSKLGVIASMQSIHCTSDGPWVIKRLGEKRARQGAYVWQKLIKSGAVVSNGTDTPVEDVNPIANFYSAVTRKMKTGAAFFAEQRMSRAEALRSLTLNAAYAAFEEEIKGSLTPGKLADIVILSQDLMTVAENEIEKTQVLYTILGGKVVYEKK
ncbi:MAG: amidohydrolase [Deltaproteobacteria bacterium]|nr:amidohydrolase [Deltaproteobacteria bacterium]